MPLPTSWANPNTTRSSVVLAIAAGIVAQDDQPLKQAKVLLREGTESEWSIALYGSATIEGIKQVVNGDSALAIVNPSTALRMAYLGTGPFERPLPVRTLAVIPSEDQLAFVVKADFGITSFEEIAVKRPALHVSTRATPGHSLHFMLADVAAAAGFTFDDLRAWGGEFRLEGSFPQVGGPKANALARGEIEALFEEGADEWLPLALDAGMRVLPLSDETIAKLEAVGFRRATIRKAGHPRLPADVPTVSFSGWPIFVHADLPDGLVRDMCAALDARKDLIPWQGDGPLPVEQMCRDSAATPIDAPLHPAAEAYWRARGYL